jgi:hypothetical protein
MILGNSHPMLLGDFTPDVDNTKYSGDSWGELTQLDRS